MTDRFNTIAGWVLFAGIVALGSSIVVGEVFHSEAPEEGGYPIPGVVSEGGSAEAEKPIAAYFAAADAAKGEQVFKKCTACHNADQGGAHALGPNLWAILGAPLAAKPGFAYSEALKGKGGTWTWDAMSEWLANPKKFAPGTKMTFAGLGNPEERANLLVWLNSKGSNLPLPAAPAEEAPADQGTVAKTDAAEPMPGSGQGDGAQKAADTPAATASGQRGGEGSPEDSTNPPQN